MSSVPQKVLLYDILQAEQRLSQAEQIHGKGSAEYQAAQRKLVRLWSMLKLMHQKEDFLQEVLS
ncbi:MAG TPA: hypothetical protein V6C99_07090 [Oculatellaceae cyanobacterium]